MTGGGDRAQCLDAPGSFEPPLAPSDAKTLVVRRALTLRREHPDWFGAESDQSPLFASGLAAEHAVAFLRCGRVAAVATRLPAGLVRSGGWGDTMLALPQGPWRCRLTGQVYKADPATGAGIAMAELISTLPVALLVRQDGQ